MPFLQRAPNVRTSMDEQMWWRHTASNQRAWDGIATGEESLSLANLGTDVTAVDISLAQIDIARQTAATAGLAVDFVVTGSSAWCRRRRPDAYSRSSMRHAAIVA